MNVAAARSSSLAVVDENDRYAVLDVKVSAVNMGMALQRIAHWVSAHDGVGTARYVCVRDVNGIVESWKDASLAAIHEQAGMVTPDGMPVVWLGKLAGYGHVDRVYGPDLMLAVCELSPCYRHFFYGGADGVGELLVDRLRARFPALEVVGTYTPPFRTLTDGERAAIVGQINAAKPDIVWVGLSTPKQERWMAEIADLLHVPVLIGVGAAFDFHAGLKAQAPRWIQRSGFEWLFRLATEPRRLWRRYLVGNTLFVALVLARIIRSRTPSFAARQ